MAVLEEVSELSVSDSVLSVSDVSTDVSNFASSSSKLNPKYFRV